MELHRVTRKELVNLYTEEAIIAVVLKISVTQVSWLLRNKSNRISNPLRIDKRPSLGMREDKGKIRLYDFANSLFRGDIFDFVGLIYNLNTYSSVGFKDSLHIVTALMRNDATIKDAHFIKSSTYKNKNKTKIEFTSVKLSRMDIAFWLNGYITKQDLDYFNVRSVINVTVNNKKLSQFANMEQRYAYIFAEYDNVRHVEIYSPSSTIKFISNFQYLKVPLFRELTEELIIIKSYKDLIVLNKILENNDKYVNIIALPSENYILAPAQVDKLNEMYDRVFIFSDYDTQGVICSYMHNRLYDFIPLMFITQYIIEFSEEEIQGLINVLYKSNILVSDTEIYDYVTVLIEQELNISYKDVYAAMKANISNEHIIYNYLNSKLNDTQYNTN